MSPGSFVDCVKNAKSAVSFVNRRVFPRAYERDPFFSADNRGAYRPPSRQTESFLPAFSSISPVIRQFLNDISSSIT